MRAVRRSLLRLHSLHVSGLFDELRQLLLWQQCELDQHGLQSIDLFFQALQLAAELVRIDVARMKIQCLSRGVRRAAVKALELQLSCCYGQSLMRTV